MKATRTRYIPTGAVKVADKHSEAVAYVYTTKNNSRPAAIIYYGKQTKAVGHHSYAVFVAGYLSVIRQKAMGVGLMIVET